ncbi:hypothetical protein HY468_02765 [Candidatus Roizmanbacteria bacterium]|nr:hypothetical protein [Candidatus Roizmanbacteria bacterium]
MMVGEGIEVVGLSLLLLAFSVLNMYVGVLILRRSQQFGDLVLQQIKGYEKLLAGTYLSWIGRLYARIFNPKRTHIAVRLAAYLLILQGSVIGSVTTIAVIIGLLAFIFV